MYIFLMRWFEKFHEFKSHDLFLTGESYAGHYIPQLAVVLLKHNGYPNHFKFNIKGIAIGNPLLKLDRDFASSYKFLWTHGIISDELWLGIASECDFDDYDMSENRSVTKQCNNYINEVDKVLTDYINPYDVIIDVCYPSIVEQELRLRKCATKMSLDVDVCMSSERAYYFNNLEVQNALHANRTNLPYEWSMCSDQVIYRETDLSINILPLLKKIIQHGIRVMVFSGDQDSVVPLLGSRSLVRDLAGDLKFNITVQYTAWFHKRQIAGWTTEYGNLLTFATVRGASHMVPYSQPSRALHMFQSFVFGRRLPTHNSPME